MACVHGNPKMDCIRCKEAFRFTQAIVAADQTGEVRGRRQERARIAALLLDKANEREAFAISGEPGSAWVREHQHDADTIRECVELLGEIK